MHALIEISIKPALRGKPLADLLVLNGPGTCVAVVGAIYLSRVRSGSAAFLVLAAAEQD